VGSVDCFEDVVEKLEMLLLLLLQLRSAHRLQLQTKKLPIIANQPQKQLRDPHQTRELNIHTTAEKRGVGRY
jgi:hypothetical protein